MTKRNVFLNELLADDFKFELFVEGGCARVGLGGLAAAGIAVTVADGSDAEGDDVGPFIDAWGAHRHAAVGGR